MRRKFCAPPLLPRTIVAATEMLTIHENRTRGLGPAVEFLRAKSEHFNHEGLDVRVRYTRAKGRDLDGYYEPARRRMVLAVKQRLRYPRAAAYGVGSLSLDRPRKGRHYELVWHEDRFEGPQDLLVFVAGHEVWHYLCDSGQRRGNFETRANCHGFLWLAEFHAWGGAGHPVAPIPVTPPRPDRSASLVEQPKQVTVPPQQPTVLGPTDPFRTNTRTQKTEGNHRRPIQLDLFASVG